MRGEFALIEAGFAKLPTILGNGSLPLFVNSGATALEATAVVTARSRLGLGSIATQNANNVAITGGSITAAPVTTNNAQISAGSVTASPLSSNNVALTGGSISGVSATGLTALSTNNATITGGSISASPITTNNAQITGGSISGVGLGTMSTQAANNVAITGGTISGIPISQNPQNAAYTTVLADAGKHILHPVADNNPRTFTIDSNANVAYAVGTVITFVNEINTVTIAITTDTLAFAADNSTGSRTLAAGGIATALKITSTKWIISGTALT